MRPIKFRVWLDEFNKMFYDVGLMGGELYVNIDGKGYDVVGDCRDFKLMQFTGLKDKNGKEIYEGDIVKARDVKVNGQDKFYICEVKWMPTGWYAMSYKDLVGTEHYLSLNILETEVIGNIYENPELLEAKGNE